MVGTSFRDLDLGPDDVGMILRGGGADHDGYRRLAGGIRALYDTQLRAGRGFAVIAAPADLSRADAKRLTVAVSRIFGTLMPQDFHGEQLREVRDRGRHIETDRTARYSDGRFGGHLHTDGMHRPGHIPDLFTLYCYRAAKAGGESVFVHVDDIIARLARFPDALSELRGWFHFDTRDASGLGPRTLPRQVIESTPDGTRVTYIREYIESGHGTGGVPPLTAAQVWALDVMDGILADPTILRYVRLAPGDLIIIDNRRLVHGRTGFVDHEDPDEARLLFRTWIDTRVTPEGLPTEVSGHRSTDLPTPASARSADR
jgi:alpha-ketoglutarate-dependent taurine dioxygenase